MMSLILILYFVGMFILLFNSNHLMLILLSIEFIYMILLFLLLTFFSLLNILSIFVFLISIVCEAGLGLSLLVMMSFYYGNEFMNSLNLIKC
uniref:NADH dehydrogenase subunit 4L n=2 Tax=Hyalomma TaxID=34625 RepID=A0A8E7DN24_9ACAR|nr:NADH dehydrogenase subunit 4L [Hyalomma anatolicum]QVV23898.1 NADH dehydrogenase subunit 4L [Hyalomma excavatum]